jgi:chaperonin GroES
MKLDFKLPFQKLQQSGNLDALLDREQSDQIGQMVVEGYLADLRSRDEWWARSKDAIKLALQVVERKTYPWVGASNVKFPLLTVATLQFSARAYSALIRGTEVVKCRVVGADPMGQKRARANRLAQHMSYQMLEQDEAWEEEHDKLLMTLPIMGCSFIKSYYDPVKGINCSKHVLPQDLVVNYWAESLEKCERKTHRFYLFDREIRERQLAGEYNPTVEISDSPNQPDPQETDQRQGLMAATDGKVPRLVLEQHLFLDLDGDGYEEPYVVTVDKDSAKVLKIVNRFGKVVTRQSQQADRLLEALTTEQDQTRQTQLQLKLAELARQKPELLRIEPLEYFTKFSFIPAPDGGFYDMGFGTLLGPINEAVNSLVNQLIDAGKLQNGSSGFIGRGARIPGGKLNFQPFEWKRVDVAGGVLRDSIVPLPVNPPSPVLFQLLGLLIQYGERIASVTEASTGENVGQNTPAYNMQAMLQQGMAVFQGIFKRIYRGFRDEYRKWYILNRIYLSAREYFQVLDGPSTEIYQSDYQGDPSDVKPAADPNAILSEEKMRQAVIIAERARMVPGYNPVAVELKFLEAMGIQDVQELYPLNEQGQPVIPPPPNPEIEVQLAEEQRRAMEGMQRAQAAKADIQIKAAIAEVDMALKEAQTVKTLAEAGAIDAELAEKRGQTALQSIDLRRQAMKDLMDHADKQADRDHDRRMAKESGNGRAPAGDRSAA